MSSSLSFSSSQSSTIVDDTEQNPFRAEQRRLVISPRSSKTHLGDFKAELKAQSSDELATSDYNVAGGDNHRTGLLPFEHHSASAVSSYNHHHKLQRRSGSSSNMFVEDEIIYFPFRQLIYFCCGLPLVGFGLCVVLSLLVHLDGATRTHCGVINYLPSISAAIGDYSPERYVWRLCIALHCAPRLTMGFIYRNYYLCCPLRPINQKLELTVLANIAAWLHVLENLTLLLLTVVSSTENHFVHVLSFCTFIASSFSYMMLNLFLFSYSGRRRSFTNGEYSYQCKTFTLLVGFCAMVLSAYFYHRHNSYCEPGVYTLFALSEYVVVVSIILYHGTMTLDFNDKKVSLSSVSSLDSTMLTTTVSRGETKKKQKT